ncbi:MAG TPA: septation protein A [Thiotrichales bacterium]|nr:MAG: septation protein A [Thiotrichales bacterium 24-47-4]OZA74085.1 MAG: septation protein A [Thiotrichales bacterium 39-47-5]HQR81877.1 septation protein A [Thiotrichales bacterium]HQR95290.1 septation protein A [Thiotrichales bacterium]
MKAFIDFIPVILFFIAYKFYDIYVATAVVIVASVIQAAYVYLTEKRIPGMLLASTGLIVLLGVATLILQDDNFIKWKPTVVNWLFAAVFIASLYIGAKPLLQRMMEGAFEHLPLTVWQRMSWVWALFFISVGIINLWVAYTFDTDTWVNFKLFGLLAITFVFIIAQSLYLVKIHQEYMPETEEDEHQEKQ